MAEGKKTVLLYCDLIHTVEKLTDVQAGKLFKHYLRYINDLNPKIDDTLIDIVFEPIKQQLKRDLKKWDVYINKQRENGKMGGRPKNPTDSQKTQRFISEPKKAVKVKDKVTVKVKDKDINKTFNEFWILYNKKIDKKKVEAKWSKLKESDKKMILLKLPAYIKATPDIKYRKNALTYLNGESWNDEIEFKPENKSFAMGGSQNTADEAQVQKEIAETKEGYKRLMNENKDRPKYESPIKKRLQSIKPK